MSTGSFTTDVTAIRQRARQKMDEGPVTSRRLLEDFLAGEEEHADDIVDLLGA